MGKTGKRHENQKQNIKRFKLGLLFGTFDPLHYGHIRLIRKASQMCDIVGVGIDSDALIRAVKGREPFEPYKNRLKDVLSIVGVDFAFQEDSKTPKKYWVDKLSPDVLIKGDDWKGKGWSGEGLGVKVKYVPYTKTISSTQLRNK